MKTWLITGCSSGIGRGIAKAVLAKGDRAVVTARNVERVTDIVADYPDTALAVALDVCDNDSIDAAVAAAKERFGGIDVLINNAGHGYRSAVEEGEIDKVAEMFQTNLFGPIELIKRVLPDMRAKKSGAIVNVSSIAAVRSAIGSGYYASSKAAIELLTNGLYKELAPLGIKVMVAEPGAFETRFYEQTSLKGTSNKIGDYEDTVGKTRPDQLKPVKRPGDPDKAGVVIVETIELDNPPKKLLLGSDAVKAVVTELTDQLREIAEWAPISRKTNFED